MVEEEQSAIQGLSTTAVFLLWHHHQLHEPTPWRHQLLLLQEEVETHLDYKTLVTPKIRITSKVVLTTTLTDVLQEKSPQQ